MDLLPSDVLYHLSTFLHDLDTVHLISTSKNIKDSFAKRSFFKKLYYDDNGNNDVTNFAISIARHYPTLQEITFKRTTNPHAWIPKWTKTVIFERCYINSNINPPIPTETEKLVLRNCNIKKRHGYQRNLFLGLFEYNTTKFPKLTSVEIKA